MGLPLGPTMAKVFLSFYEIKRLEQYPKEIKPVFYRRYVDIKLSNVFRFKDCSPSDLVSGVVYKYTCGRCNTTYYGETDRHLKVRSGEHTGISPWTFKKTKPSKESATHNHLLNCNKIPSFEEFTFLTNGNNKFDLEIKESLLI